MHSVFRSSHSHPLCPPKRLPRGAAPHLSCAQSQSTNVETACDTASPFAPDGSAPPLPAGGAASAALLGRAWKMAVRMRQAFSWVYQSLRCSSLRQTRRERARGGGGRWGQLARSRQLMENRQNQSTTAAPSPVPAHRIAWQIKR